MMAVKPMYRAPTAASGAPRRAANCIPNRHPMARTRPTIIPRKLENRKMLAWLRSHATPPATPRPMAVQPYRPVMAEVKMRSDSARLYP